jgi:hypothetical protein
MRETIDALWDWRAFIEVWFLLIPVIVSIGVASGKMK